MNKLAVFASGTGTLFEAILKQGLQVDLLLADRPCRAIDVVAREGDIPAIMIERSFSKDFHREEFTQKIIRMLQEHRIDAVAMAGFMTVLSSSIFKLYGGRIFNTHPSLLPKFKGAHAVRKALESGAKVTGCTIHIATEDLDAGRIIAQEVVPIFPDDTEESLHERIKEAERILYPTTIIKEFMARSM